MCFFLFMNNYKIRLFYFRCRLSVDDDDDDDDDDGDDDDDDDDDDGDDDDDDGCRQEWCHIPWQIGSSHRCGLWSFDGSSNIICNIQIYICSLIFKYIVIFYSLCVQQAGKVHQIALLWHQTIVYLARKL